jgi:GNAT superfamily N-acetyltransferase
MMNTGKNVVDPTTPTWRLASVNDIDAIAGLAEIIHPALPERPDVFVEKLSLFAPGCYVLVWHEEVVGYGLSHPWNLNCIPPLDSFLKGIPGDADCLYVHDVAILPDVRGHGSAERYVELIEECSRKIGVDFLVLVSVYSTQRLWAQCGFEVANSSEFDVKLRSYGPTAKYMIRNLKSP